MRPRRALAAALVLLAGLLAAAPLRAQGDPSFNLVNRSGQAISEIYVTPVSRQDWGRDLLGSGTLAHGRSFAVRIPPAAGCRQDVRVVFADGRPEERRNVDTCRIVELAFGNVAAPGQASGANPSFNLVNHGAQAIRQVYVSSVRENNWGQERLTQPLQPGSYLPVSLPLDDCLNDVRIVWMDGRDEERRRIDTCQMVNLVFE